MDEERQRVFASNGGNIGVKYYLTDLGDGRHAVERAVDNVWDDIPGLGTTPGEDLGYPTQKTAALLERIVATATRPGDLVFDPFVGSGTTLAVAHRLGRRWLGCDAARGAIQTATRRMQAVVQEIYSQATFLEAASFQEGVGHHFSVSAVAPVETFLEAASFQDGVGQGALLPPVHVSITRIPEEPARIRVAISAPPVVLPDAGAGQEAVDWRAVVDSIAIDPAYDGVVLRATFADAPQRKQDQVRGSYELPAPAQPTTVAVRFLDIAGNEMLVTRRI